MIHNKILQEIKNRKEIYKRSPYDMVSAYNREIETEKEYNGRQLLELLQNADDEQSTSVLIKLDTKNNLLSISNRGDSCKPFSYAGIRSLMISNLSSKTTKKFIGNKGLGFRSIINWSEKITINSAGLDIVFSREIVDRIFDELFDVKEQKQIREDRKLPQNIKPIPFLSIPAVLENAQEEWTTSIQIHYKFKYEDDIYKQIKELKNEILLFLNHIENLVVMVDDEILLDVDKSKLSQQWTIYQRREKLPKELWDKENEEEHFDLKIALQDNLHNEIKELFAYFPTKIDINLPFIVHGTFELNSSRNDINDSPKNRYILKELVALIISTAKELTKEEVSYKALEMLAYTTKNTILDSLGFYDAINEAILNLKVFPCLDETYREMDEVIFIDELSSFVHRTKNAQLFDNLLIPLSENINLDAYSLGTIVDTEKLNILSANINSIQDRADFIYMFYNTFRHEEKFELLIDNESELIGVNDDVYTPSNKDFSIPSYVNIKFIHPELFNRLVILFNIPITDKTRELQRKLKDITNIHSYEPVPVLQKIIASTNRELRKEGVKQDIIVKEMVQSLYENYILLDKTDIPSGTKVQLLNQNNTLSDASDLFLSNDYPSGELTQMLFEYIFSNDEFLADITTYNLEDEPLDDVELFFLWLGVNQISKLVPTSQLEKNTYCRVYFSSIKGKPDYAHHMTIGSAENIYKLDEIAQKISLEKFILWAIKDKHIYDSFNEKTSVTLRGSRGGYINNRNSDTSFIYYQLQSLNLYKDYLIGNEKLSALVNSNPFNFKYQEFEKYNINKSDIESMMLKLGAVDKFEKLSIKAVSRIVSELPNNASEGKQVQSLYKLCIKHFEHHQKPLMVSDDVKLFAKRDEEKRYFNRDEVFYNGNIKLPKKITKTKAILDFPRRQSTTNVIGFFVINNLNEINIDIVEKEIDRTLTDKFKDLLEQIKEYILVYRIKDIETDKTADAELRKLQNLKIVLCSSVAYKIDDEIYELDNNDYIKDAHEYLIKIDNAKSLNNIIGDKFGFEFQESFADIIGLVFDIQETHVFRNMIKEDTSYIEQIIRNDIGSDELIRARELLGKTDEYYSFWKTVYDLKGKEYTLLSDDKMFEIIKKEFALSIAIESIDYRYLNTFKACKQIEQLFMELDFIVEDFNNKEPFYKIDCLEFHKVNLQQAFDANSMLFQRLLYSYCLDEQNEKEFNNLKALYNQNTNYIMQQAEQHRFKMEVDYKAIVQEYIEDNFSFEGIKVTKIDFKDVYEENVTKVEIDKLNGNSHYISLLYFPDSADEINNYIRSLEQSSFSTTTDTTKVFSEPKAIEEVSLTSVYFSSTEQSLREKPRKAYKHNFNTDTQKQKRGEKAELEVYQSLCSEYGKDNVEHVSLDDDSLGYDIKYKNKENIYKYVEVKNFSNGQFYLTRNEKKFAKNNFGFYELFLVSDTILKIQNIDYNDNAVFQLDSSEYIVKYSIK